MMTLILIGIFLTELIKYGIWFRGIQGLRFKRLGLGCALAGSYVLLILMGVVDVETLLLVYSIVAVAVCGMMLECRKGRLIYVLQVFFMTLCISEAIAIIIKLYNGRLWKDFFELKVNYLCNNLVAIFLFYMWSIIKNKIPIIRKNREIILQWVVQGIVMIIGMVIFFVINGFQHIAEYSKDDELTKMAMVMSLASFVFLAGLIVMVSYIFSQNRRYKLYLEKDKLLFETQKTMYETMLIKNEEIRSFRHDIHNHLMCLEEMIDLGDIEKVKDYVCGMEGKLSPNDSKTYIVGNDVIDVVLNYYISLLDENVKVKIEGECHNNIKMSDVELCTVVSNLIQNATEALNQLDISEKILEIEFLDKKGYLFMKIINTIFYGNLCMGSKGEKNFLTTKRNKERHGFGIRNAEETLNKNGGVLHLDIKQNEFVAIAMIPIE